MRSLMRLCSYLVIFAWVLSPVVVQARGVSGADVVPGAGSEEAVPTPMELRRSRRLLERGLRLQERGQLRLAIHALEKARGFNPSDRPIRHYLARLYVSLGERYARQGLSEKQRQYFQKALSVDPHLLDNSAFVARYQKLQTTSKAQQIAEGLIPRAKRPVFSPGIGITLGIEGLLGIQVGALFVGMFNPVVTFSPVLQTLDASVRWIWFRTFRWSPYLSAGATFQLPLWKGGNTVDLHGPVFHAGVGVHYISRFGFTFLTGLNLAYAPNNKEWPLTPIPTVQLSWYF